MSKGEAIDMGVETRVCYVFGAGETCELRTLPAEGDLVIAADGGVRFLREQGLRADVTVGDFDSLGFVPEGEQVRVFSSDKDETDLMIACREGLARGYRMFRLYGGLGGARISHTMANLQMLRWLADQGAAGTLYGRSCEVTLLRDRTVRFPAEQTGFLSLFAAGEQAVVTVRGAKYELEKGRLTGSFSLGVSNEFCGRETEVTAHEGDLLVILEPAEKSFCKTVL